MVEAYHRKDRKIDGEWKYSIQTAYEEFRNEFPDEVFDYNNFRQNVTNCANLYRTKGSINRKKISEKLKKRT